MRITSIKFSDYRAFFNGKDDEYLVNVNSKNVLIYGENGSGKTSFFRGVKDYINGEDFVENIFKEGVEEGYIDITFSDNSSERFAQSNNKSVKTEIINAAKLNSFISYRELLKTYFIDGDLNLFDLLVNGILQEHLLDTFGQLQAAFQSIKRNDIDSIANELREAVNKKELTQAQAVEQLAISKQKLADEAKKFSDELQLLIKNINQDLNKILIYFSEYLAVDLVLNPALITDYNKVEITPNVKYFGNTIANYHQFLNEAKLSALALSIYLAAIKSNPTKNALKVLFLDDIFIGLDMSNRLPLLEILDKEFNDWQIFLTTYDRNWFELIKIQLKPQSWVILEMYSEDRERINASGETKIIGEKPVLIESSVSYLKKARQYFKSKDYPACSNYLRKELERVLRRLLPLERRITIDENFGTKDETKLENLLNNFVTYIDDCNIKLSQSIFDAVKLYRKLVLNPQSHDDISSPIFRAELDNAFNAVKALSDVPQIKVNNIASIGTKFTYVNALKNYSVEILLADNIYRVTCGSDISISKYKFRIVRWEWNAIPFATTTLGNPMVEPQLSQFCDQKQSLEQIFQKISHGTGIQVPMNIEQVFFLGAKSFHDLLAK